MLPVVSKAFFIQKELKYFTPTVYILYILLVFTNYYYDDGDTTISHKANKPPPSVTVTTAF